jgi:hypothetical protein
MEVLDRILGLLEVVLVPASPLWLCLDGARRRSVLTVGVVALTVAQPFGIVATSQSGPPPAGPRKLDPSGVHIARLDGVPVMPFVIYRRQDLLAGFGDSGATATLRARSWFWLPILTNSTNISDLAAPWVGEVFGLVEKGDDLWLTLTNPSFGYSQFSGPHLLVWKHLESPRYERLAGLGRHKREGRMALSCWPLRYPRSSVLLADDTLTY